MIRDIEGFVNGETFHATRFSIRKPLKPVFIRAWTRHGFPAVGFLRRQSSYAIYVRSHSPLRTQCHGERQSYFLFAHRLPAIRVRTIPAICLSFFERFFYKRFFFPTHIRTPLGRESASQVFGSIKKNSAKRRMFRGSRVVNSKVTLHALRPLTIYVQYTVNTSMIRVCVGRKRNFKRANFAYILPSNVHFVIILFSTAVGLETNKIIIRS